MMIDGYFLPPRKARHCRWIGTLFLLAAAIWGIAAVAGALAPGLRIACEIPKPCTASSDPVLMLTEDEQKDAVRDPATRKRVDAWVARPDVRIGLGVLGLVEDGPATFVLLALGLALRRLGTRGDKALAQAIPWLKKASRVAIFWAILPLFTNGIRSLLLSPGTGFPQFPIDLGEVPLPLLLSIGAYASAWAVEAGIRAERDLADFI